MQQKLTPYEVSVASMGQSLSNLHNREVNVFDAKKRLETAILEYENYENIIANTLGWQELDALKQQESKLSNEIGQISLAIVEQQALYVDRKRTLNNLADSIAKSIPGLSWGVFDCNITPPFHMGPMHSTTYGVLETLAGDLMGLLDSGHPENFHPGFLLHDSPREAEMSEALFWALLQVAINNPLLSIQYVVTTSTEAPKKFEDYVRVRLHTREDDGFLFKRRIGMEAKPLSL